MRDARWTAVVMRPREYSRASFELQRLLALPIGVAIGGLVAERIGLIGR